MGTDYGDLLFIADEIAGTIDLWFPQLLSRGFKYV